MAHSFFRKAPRFWERRGPTALVLWPLAWLYGVVLRIGKLIFDLGDLGLSNRQPASVPIIIVGNIRVGGTGKTPIVIALAQSLSQQGWRPGIISRGYGSVQISPTQVHSNSDPMQVGDEPVLIAKRTHDQFPVWVFPKRRQSIAALLKHAPDVNVIISDDGLQHRGLSRWPAREGGRDIEFVVRDGRGEGNGFLLPAGPLRESADRGRDATLFTESSNKLKSGLADEYFMGRRAFTLLGTLSTPYQLINANQTQTLSHIAEQFSSDKIAIVAALGNPQRFFAALQKHGIAGQEFALPDHASYSPEFFNGIKAQCILMTEKDAVKCADITDERIWVVPLSLNLPDNLVDWLQSILQRPDPHRYNL